MISVRQKRNQDRAEKHLQTMLDASKKIDIDYYGRAGVEALRDATPKDTGLTAESWSYRITRRKGVLRLQFLNSNIQNGFPIAILIQYGHGTRNGGYVAGRDYINPALRPIFDSLADKLWKEVTKK